MAQSVANRTLEEKVTGSIPRTGQHFFRGLLIVIATGFIPLSPLSIFFDDGYVGKQPVALEE